jgi:hypothetical protein
MLSIYGTTPLNILYDKICITKAYIFYPTNNDTAKEKTKMNEEEIIAAIEAVETVRQRLKNAKTLEEALKLVDQDLETAHIHLDSLDYEAFCPNGCGTKLVKRKFVDVFNVDTKEPEERDIEENLYCPHCKTRWIAEQHEPLKTEEELKTGETAKMTYKEVSIRIPKPFYDDLLTYLNKNPYYEDFEEFCLEALRKNNLKRIVHSSV